VLVFVFFVVFVGFSKKMTTVFVDGSYFPKQDRAGAGIFFSSGCGFNKAFPVPRPLFPASLMYDSVRSELYASLLAVHVCLYEKKVNRFEPITIQQDSKVALDLLAACFWDEKSVRPSENKRTFSVTYTWGETITEKTILSYVDVLDEWWLMTQALCNHQNKLTLHWVKAHTEEEHTDNKFTWNGNNQADRLAKCGAEIDMSDTEPAEYFQWYPLFPSRPMPVPHSELYWKPLTKETLEILRQLRDSKNSRFYTSFGVGMAAL